MDQNAPIDPNVPDVQKPLQQQPSNTQKSKTLEFTRARIFSLILCFSLILIFNGNAIIQTGFAVLGISTFQPLFDPILELVEKLITWATDDVWRPFFRNHLPPLGSWFKRRHQVVTLTASVLALAALLAVTTLRPLVATRSGTLNDFFCLKTPLPWFTCSSGYGVAPLPDGVRIGLIHDATFGQFDQSSLNQDERKVETLIFDEDSHACTGQHITIIAVTMLSRTIEDPLSGATLGLQNLRGYYLWQHAYNATHPTTRLCLAIANLGTPDTANANSSLVKAHPNDYSIPQVILQIAQLAHSDPTVRGIVGFPYSQQVIEVVATLKMYPNLPPLSIISPTASSDNLSNMRNLYRIDAPDQSQGQAIADYFCRSLFKKSASIAILTDNADAYSGDLPLDFKESISKNCVDPEKIPPLINYTNGDSQSIQTAIDTAVLDDHANYIFFPGYDEDLDTVESELHSISQSSPSVNPVTLLGGDGLNNVDATTHYAYNLVYAATFAQSLPLSDSLVQDFQNEGFSKRSFAGGSPNELWIPKDTLLAVDAVHAFTAALNTLPPAHFTPSDFNNALASVIFSGESGQIVFQGMRVTSGHISDRDQETVYITCYDHNHTLNKMASYVASIDTESVQEISAHQNSCS